MTITRLIYITIDPADTDRAMQVWKKECAPLMIQQKGCISDGCCAAATRTSSSHARNGNPSPTSRCTRTASAHEEIVRHTRGLKGAKAQVRLYEAVT